MKVLFIDDEKNNSTTVEKLVKPLLMEFFASIFEGQHGQTFLDRLIYKYESLVKDIENFTKQSEYDELVKSISFKNLVNKIIRIILFAEFHDPQLNIKIDVLEDNNVELRTFKPSECICIDGLVKENKNYLVLLSPPLLKNGYPYQGLKPLVIMYDIKPEEIRDILGTYINDKPKFLTENKIDTSEERVDISTEEKQLKQSLSNFELKTVNFENFSSQNEYKISNSIQSFKPHDPKKYFHPSKNKTERVLK
jgi:hypothetical protein